MTIRCTVINSSMLRTDDLCIADIEIDVESGSAQRCGERIRLTPIEFRLLSHLLRHPGHAFSRTEMMHVAWPNLPFVVPCTIDTHMARLRKALNADRRSCDKRSQLLSVGSINADASHTSPQARTASRTLVLACGS